MWDRRGYYYRHARVNSKPRRVYVGGGTFGEMVADADTRQRARRTAAADQVRRLREQDRAACRAIDGEYRAVHALAAALLTAAGYYQHKREWRRMDLKAFAQRYREAAERDTAAAAGKTAHSGGPAKLTGPTDDAPDRDAVERDLAALVERVNGPKPKRADLDALRAALDGGAGAGITVLSGGATLTGILDAVGGGEAAQMVMRADADRMAKTLGRDTAPAFERPLIDHVVTCWVRLQLVERDMTRSTAGSHSRDTGAYWDKRLTEAQRRYLRAVNLLAKLRHLGPAQVQVNVANQQVVVNGDS